MFLLEEVIMCILAAVIGIAVAVLFHVTCRGRNNTDFYMVYP